MGGENEMAPREDKPPMKRLLRKLHLDRRPSTPPEHKQLKRAGKSDAAGPEEEARPAVEGDGEPGTARRELANLASNSKAMRFFGVTADVDEETQKVQLRDTSMPERVIESLPAPVEDRSLGSEVYRLEADDAFYLALGKLRLSHPQVEVALTAAEAYEMAERNNVVFPQLRTFMHSRVQEERKLFRLDSL